MLKILKQRSKKGTILLEALLALAIGSAILTAVGNALVGSQRANLQAIQKQKAELYLQEAEEAVKSLWLSGWESVNLAGVYHPEIVSGNWVLTAGEENLGFYSRRIEIDQVFRDGEGNVATQGGTLDPSTKKITTVISWPTPVPLSIVRSFFLTRYLNNTTWKEDTAEDFADGIEDATDVTSNPGYVQLAQTGGAGDWTEPTIIGAVNATANANGILTDNGYLFLALGSAKKQIEVFDIAAEPASPSALGIFDTADDVNNLALAGNYLYAALGNASHGIQIFDISLDPVNPIVVGSAETNDEPSGLWIQDSYLFASVLGDNSVEVYNLADPLNPSFEGSFSTTADTEDVSGSGNYLYVAQDSTSQAVEVFDISSSVTSPTSLGTFSSLYRPTGVWLEGNTLYLALKQKRASMYTLTINPRRPLLLGIFETEQNTSDITALGDYGYVSGMDSWQRAIEVIFIGDSKGLSGAFFVYGEYTSSTLDAGAQVGFNRISWSGEEPSETNILLQVSSNDDNLTWNFVGPDGTPASYFEEPGAIPLNSVLGRYFKYKIILTGNGDVTPRVDYVRVNYSP